MSTACVPTRTGGARHDKTWYVANIQSARDGPPAGSE